jgi:hypothetical protein
MSRLHRGYVFHPMEAVQRSGILTRIISEGGLEDRFSNSGGYRALLGKCSRMKSVEKTS